jgi:hypothetical protein
MTEKPGGFFPQLPCVALRPRGRNLLAIKASSHTEQRVVPGDFVATNQTKESGCGQGEPGAPRLTSDEKIRSMGSPVEQEF